ncbi:uncharacterized protein LOC142355780 isoform X2 [Convolutriloba macropyga]|uniref:uncharacterized protein LOC142355780 isoform X2 n=1 Tax=Convolutriloba macropyga TaxID=536237 RepID=UPI003F51DD11
MNSNYDQPQSSNGSMQNRLNFSSASTPPKRPATGTQETSGLPSNGFGNGTRTRPVTSVIRQGGQGRASDTGNSSLTGSTATLVPNGYQNNYNNPRSMRDSNQRSSRPPFVPTSKEFSTTQAMVQGLPISINKQMLIDAFSPYGSLQYAYASAPKPDRSFIIGFIGYDHPESLERMWSETNRRIVINGNEYEVKPAFHKEYEMLEKTLERRGAAFAGSQETRSTVSTNQQQQLQQSSSSPRVPSNNQSDLSGYCATSETAAAIPVKNQMMLPSHPQPVVAGSSNQQAAPVANATSSLPQSAVSSPIKSLPAPPSSSTSSANVTKLPTLANINFIDLCQQSLIPVTPKKYNNYMDIVFEVRDVIVNQDLQKMLNEAGQNAVIGTITYVVPGEIVIAENPNKSPGTFSRFVVRSFNVDTNLAMLEDLDSCEHCEVSVEILRPINDECCALPVAHFHGGLINCEPLPDKVDEVNELVEECIMGEEQSSDAPVFVQVYRQIYNWVDCEASDKDIVEEAFSKIMIEGGVAKAPQTAEEWTRTRAVDPLKLTKGVERECTVVVNESPNDLSMHVNGLVDGDLLCSVWPSIELNPVPNYRPFPMEVVCTLHDDQWLRANVLKVTDSSATLYCIDWGDIIEQPFSKIRPATSQFLHDDQHNTMPGMAIRVSMHGLKYPTKFTEEQIELFKSICKVDDIFNLKIVELNKRRRAYVGDLIKNGENVLELCLKNGIVEESSLAEPVTSKVATSPPEQVQDEVENVYEQPPVEAELDSAVSDMASMQLNGETGVVDLNEQVAQMARMIRRMDEKMNMMMERLQRLENAQN